MTSEIKNLTRSLKVLTRNMRTRTSNFANVTGEHGYSRLVDIDINIGIALNLVKSAIKNKTLEDLSDAANRLTDARDEMKKALEAAYNANNKQIMNNWDDLVDTVYDAVQQYMQADDALQKKRSIGSHVQKDYDNQTAAFKTLQKIILESLSKYNGIEIKEAMKSAGMDGGTAAALLIQANTDAFGERLGKLF